MRNLVFHNAFTPFIAIALLISGLFFMRYVAFVAYNQYARATFMKPFYEKVARAEQYNKELPLSHFVTRATTHAVETSGKGRQGWIENCTVSGRYFDYQSHKQLNSVRFCSYGYISYFWVNALDAPTIGQAMQQMQATGWASLDSIQNQATIRQNINTTQLASYAFSRSDGIKADMVFINKSLELQNSGSFSAYPYWDFVTHTKDPHNFFIAINVSYSAMMQGNQIVGN